MDVNFGKCKHSRWHKRAKIGEKQRYVTRILHAQFQTMDLNKMKIKTANLFVYVFILVQKTNFNKIGRACSQYISNLKDDNKKRGNSRF